MVLVLEDQRGFRSCKAYSLVYAVPGECWGCGHEEEWCREVLLLL